MKILALHRQQSAVGYYRTFVPAKLMAKAGHEVTVFPEAPWERSLKPNPVEWLKAHIGEFDIIMVDRAWQWEEAALFAGYRHYSKNTRMIVDFDDDFTNIPWWNSAYQGYQPGQELRESGLGHLRLAEATTVSTPILAERFEDKTHNIFCAPNYIDPVDWENLKANPERGKDDSLYILYGGAAGHFGDLDEIKEGIQAVVRKPPVNLRLICFGALPAWLHELSREHPERVLTLPWIPFDLYPQVIAWGGFDLAIAPLAAHPFNEAKSNIKWLEAGIQRIPFFCSDIGPYKEIPSECAIKVDNTPAQWSEGLRAVLKDSALRKRLVERAYENVKENWTVDGKESLWHDIIERVSAIPRIESLENTRFAHDPPPPPEELPAPAVTKGVVSVPDPEKEKRIVTPR